MYLFDFRHKPVNTFECSMNEPRERTDEILGDEVWTYESGVFRDDDYDKGHYRWPPAPTRLKVDWNFTLEIITVILNEKDKGYKVE